MVFKYLKDCCAEKGRDPFSVAAPKEEWIEIHGRGDFQNERCPAWAGAAYGEGEPPVPRGVQVSGMFMRGLTT